MPLRQHQGSGVDGCDITAAQPDIEDVDDVDGLLPEPRSAHHLVADDRGIVDQDVEPALLTLHPFEQRLRLLVITVVDGDGDARPARGGDPLGRLVNCAGQRGLAPASPSAL